MTLRQNLIFAEEAATYACDKLQGRASNRSEDIMHAVLGPMLGRALMQAKGESADPEEIRKSQIEIVREQLEDKLLMQRRRQDIHQNRIASLENERDTRRETGKHWNADAIIKGKFGNCDEHAAVACSYLKRKGISSYIVTTDPFINHVFVVLGLKNGLDGTTARAPVNAAPGEPFSAADAVVCDPWYHEWFSIRQDWSRKMHRIILKTRIDEDASLTNVLFNFSSDRHVS